MLARVRTVACKLQLPESSRILPVFCTSQLKKHIGMSPTQSTLPTIDEQGLITAEPIATLKRKLGKKGQ